MEDIKKVKTLISRINRKCDKEGISLFDALKTLDLDNLNYLKIIGLNISLINDTIKGAIDNLFLLKDTRLIMSLDMESLKQDEIEIYSKNSNQVVHFLQDKITLDEYTSLEDEEYIYEETFTCISRLNEEISYKLYTTTSKDDLKKRIISEKYPLKHMRIIVSYKNDTIDKVYEFTINQDMLKSDLNFIIRVLHNFGFLESFSILNKYPSSIKIVGESINKITT